MRLKRGLALVMSVLLAGAGHCYADWFGECESTDEDRRE